MARVFPLRRPCPEKAPTRARSDDYRLRFERPVRPDDEPRFISLKRERL